MATRINGYAVAALAGGTVLFWSGLTGKSVLATVQSVIRGESPAANPAVNTAADPAATAAALSPGTAGPAPTVSGNYSITDLEALWTSQGGSSNTAFEAANIAMAESGGNARVTSSNPDGGINVGLWQLDTKGVGSGHTVTQLQDPATNARITIQATADGTNWREWADAVVVNGQYTGPKV